MQCPVGSRGPSSSWVDGVATHRRSRLELQVQGETDISRTGGKDLHKLDAGPPFTAATEFSVLGATKTRRSWENLPTSSDCVGEREERKFLTLQARAGC